MKISIKKKEKILEQILAYLFQKNPQSIFTSHIAEELARDEEFIKKLLLELKKKKIIIEIKKNKERISYKKKYNLKLY